MDVKLSVFLGFIIDGLITRLGHFGNTIILFVYPPKFCISIVFVFSWGHCKSQEKLETMLMQNLGGQTKSVMVFSEVAYTAFPLVINYYTLSSDANLGCQWWYLRI